MQRPGPLVPTDWLAAHLADPAVVILDGSFKLPGATPTAPEEYAQAHIPGAHFFDIDAIADHSVPLPHMLPSSEDFAREMGRMGIGNDTLVIVYDRPGLMSAGRVWWTLRVFGHDNVAVLDGGLRKWQAEGRPVTSEVPAARSARFVPQFRPELVRSRAQMMANLDSRAEQVIDARPAARFSAAEPEARPGLRSGHMPGSLNLPFSAMTDPGTGQVLPPAALRAAFEGAGLDLTRPITASCGSGVTAAALAFGLSLLGHDHVAVYDGAWAEWGLPGETPVEIG